MASTPPPRPPAAEPAPAGAPSRLVSAPFVLTCLAAFAFFFSHQLCLLAMPLYALHRGGTERDAGLLTLLFTLAAFVSRLPVAWAMERWGRRPVLLAGGGVAALTPLLYPAVGSLTALFPLRLFHGLAMGFFSTAAAVVVTDVLPVPRRGEGMGYYGMGSNVALAMGPMISLAVVERFSFPPLFLLAAGMGTISAFLGGAVRETGGRAPVPFSLRPRALFLRSVAFPAVIMGALTVAHGSLVTFLPLLGQARPVGNPGAFFTVAAAALVSVRAKAGAFSDRWGRGPIIVPGMFLASLSMVLLGRAHGRAALLLAGAVWGVGFGMAQPALMALVADRAGHRDRGRAITTFYTGWELGIGLGAYALGYLLSRTDFTVTYWAAGFVVALGALGYLLAPGHWRRRSEGTAR